MSLSLVDVEVRGRLRPTSLSLHPGALVAVVGENGAGKSTLLDVLAGVLAPDAGSATLDGAPLASLTPRDRARAIASLGQRLPSCDELTVEERIAQGLAPRRGHALLDEPTRARARAIAAELGLEAQLHTTIGALSGGFRRRAHVARALVDGEARVLVVDEPHAGVDVAQQALVSRALSRRARAGQIVVFSVHELAVALQCADRLIGLRAGRVVLDGPPAVALTPASIEALYGISGARVVDEGGAVGVLLPRDVSPRP
ncbi:MAG: ABC transporter ATP-binding protein [Deltaproteobacteria bacterium]|nr:ABC transporter ATP-binding protein [Deltaproteobacteria bacterium]